ncbi:MAG: hypothetical protein ABSD10_01605 [Candidatus Saccharimonadales bacterium]
MRKLNILIDESVTQVDKKSIRVSVCCVEYLDDAIKDDLQKLQDSFEKDEVRYPKTGKKIHFSELNIVQQSDITEIISKSDITAKVYVYYFLGMDEARAKVAAVEATIHHVQLLHRTRDIDISLETAQEYKSSSISKYLSAEKTLFIFPDAILSIFCNFLGNQDPRKTAVSLRLYTLIREKIRLQVFRSYPKIEYNTRLRRL